MVPFLQQLLKGVTDVMFGYIAFWQGNAILFRNAAAAIALNDIRRYAFILALIIAGLVGVCLFLTGLAILGLYTGWVGFTCWCLALGCIALSIAFAILSFCGEALSLAILSIMLAKNLVVDPHIWLTEHAVKLLGDTLRLGGTALQRLVRVIAALIPGAKLEEINAAFQATGRAQQEIEPLLQSAERTLLKFQDRAKKYAWALKMVFTVYLFSALSLIFLDLLFKFGTHEPNSIVASLSTPLVIGGVIVLVIASIYAALVPYPKTQTES